MYLKIRAALLYLIALSVGGAVGIDDTYQQVLAEKGQPTGKMQAGDNMVLRYPDATIRLRGGKVIAVESVKNQAAPPAAAKQESGDAAAAARTEAAPLKISSAAGASKAAWSTDYRGALAAAKESNRRVFVFFTGSDWCGWCMRLKEEVLGTPEFARYAADNLLLLEVDFPNKKPQSGDVKAQNAALARQYKIEGYPTVVVLDANGRSLGRLGYQPGGPGPFLKQLKSL
jgi:thioredoxin-related protein